MMSLAGDSVTVTQIDGAAPANGDVDTGKTVTVEGSVTLTKSVLQSEYKLAYDEKEGQYYYRPKNPDGTYGDLTALGPRTSPAEAAKADAWGEVLSQLGGDVALAMDGGTPKIEVDEKGDVTLSFTADFTTTKPSVYTLNQSGSGSFGVTLPDDDDHRPEILEKVYGLHGTDTMAYTINFITPDGHASITSAESYSGNMLVFDTEDGSFSYIGSQDQNSASLTFNASATDLTGATVDLSHFTDISIDFSSLMNINNGKVSTAGLTNGDGSSNNLGSGRKHGELIGVEIGQDGKIRASYDNGMTKLLGQIAVAKFANAAGLAKAGNNLYSTTMNSGDFDGIGIDITSDGEGSMESGVLEMSNVDLASEFTEMITTQRGFQANSRIITTSDSMLEELVNLKR
ncbi:MAG: flagellar hook-basal body complex protein [Lachnospiraceae bacterium]|nr:flagellar hook-basal body complex protein [Lachnospiraceae bacterium]